jgi:PspAA-like protein
VIVRIATEGQFELDDACVERLNAFDNAVVEAVDAGDETTARRNLAELISLIRHDGRAVPDDELVTSDVIVPPPDATLDELGSHFSGEGLIPG